MLNTDVLIIGGGLAGLKLADALHTVGCDFALLEARDRLGGRIKAAHSDSAAFDMGPAWFWPGQPRMAALVDRFGLSQFNQFAAGELSFEDERGQVQRGRGYASMQGSYRLAGGMATLIDGLAQGLPQGAVRLGQEVSALQNDEAAIVATTAKGEKISARRVVLAVPPRIAAGLAYQPALSPEIMEAMALVPTWMAGQAKAIAVYDRPFWRDAGLSGDAMSRHGPMVEIHDASPMDDSLGALFGFIGVPPNGRSDADALRSHCIAQFVRLFGAKASDPKDLFLKDWAFDRHTATIADRAPMYAHPSYGLPPALRGLWEGQLLFGGTEVATAFGGYLEGALEAAEMAFAALNLESEVV